MSIAKHVISAAVGAAVALSAATGTHYFNPVAKTCQSEDSNNCRWDGSVQGNGTGKSYIVTHSGNVFYFDPSMSAHPKHPFYGIKH